MVDIIKEYRGSRSMQEMADIYGVTPTTWLRWEHGRAYPRGARILKLAMDMGITVDELFHALGVTSKEKKVVNA